VVYTPCLSSDFSIGQLFVFNWIGFRTKKDRQLSLERKELQNSCIPPNKNKSKKGLVKGPAPESRSYGLSFAKKKKVKPRPKKCSKASRLWFGAKFPDV